MMSLLTPTESRVFQPFLDTATLPMDWSMQFEISHEHMPPAHGTEALTKATKDLMSLDGLSLRYPLSPPPSSSSRSAEAQLPPQNRAALLSPSQKKANHIQSEQKRRANIRRGYDALCETIPALREACQAEDEQQLMDGKPKGRRRGKGKAKSDDGERVDGRAGPRSENVVLSKTIEYLHELLSEREALMQRLHAARGILPANHPLLCPTPDTAIPLWERKWSGGEEKGNDDDEEEDEDE